MAMDRKEQVHRPSDFPIGSAESRAAGRMTLETRKKADKRTRIVFIIYSEEELLPKDKVVEYEKAIFVWTFRRRDNDEPQGTTAQAK